MSEKESNKAGAVFGHSALAFDRSHYIEHMSLFESGMLEDAGIELSEFNHDADDLAFELAYTRARVAFLESRLAEVGASTEGL